MSFESLGLRAELLRAVADQGYTEPTPIQRQAIPHILKGHDLMGGAQTGTGKTAGFTLPLLQQLMQSHAEDGRHRVRALILTPTRELAQQVGDSVHIYGRHLPLRSAIVYGGVNFNQQLEQIKKGVDVLIATPGRLLDHVGQKTLNLSKVEIFVLDEADRMLDMGFIPDVRRIARLLPKKRQTMLFSATLPPEIRMLAHDFLHDPVTVQVAPPNTAAEQVKQVIHTVDRSRKRELLVKLIKEGAWEQVLVFVNMKVDASSLTQQLQRDGINASAIHGDRTQEKRTKALAGFKNGKIAVLVATDVASRGLDIDQLPHVVNFELPQVPEDYIHRIGRTGRAGKEGEAVSLVSPEEEVLLKNIQSLLGIDIPRVSLPEFEPDSRLTRRALKTRTRTAPVAADSSGDDAPHVHWSRHADTAKDADKKQSTG